MNPAFDRRLTYTLLFSSALCFCISIARFSVSGSKLYLFLNWNLFLAGIPWAIALFVQAKPRLQNNGAILSLFLIIWLLFFPNAPYILTDLVHLRQRPTIPLWFDLILVLSFAWTGLIFGFASLFKIEECTRHRLHRSLRPVAAVLILFLCSFGIYLGRYLRWNSWDIVQDPAGLLTDISNCILNPDVYSKTWGFTVFMGVLLNIMYWTLKPLVASQSLLPRRNKSI